jgi:hypothetical protein
MTNGLAFLLGACAMTVPSILWFSFLAWNAPELDFREDSEPQQ